MDKILIKNEGIDEELKKTFSLTIPLENYLFLMRLIAEKKNNGIYNYKLKNAFIEGLELLKEQYPNVSNITDVERRHYKGGIQSSKIKSYSTSTILLTSDIKWIDNFINEKSTRNEFFSKNDFIIELVENLEKYYLNLKKKKNEII